MPTADVYQGSNLVAHLDRRLDGVRLEFVPDAPLNNGFLATTLPPRTLESRDLPPFFLNLLPEGARLQLLLDSAKAKDDTLGLLLKTGWDTIGDVAVLPHGESPGQHLAATTASKLHQVSFWDLFYRGATETFDNSVPGVQEKISASTIAFGLRAAGIPSAILKLNPPKFPRLVHNEEFFLRMARDCGLQANKAEIVHDRHGEPGLLVTRFDRVKRDRKVLKLHQEDGCQLLNSVPANKYDLPLCNIADSVARVSTSAIVEIERLLRLVAFSYLIGNGDLHAKNISVIWQDVVRLSPGYDLLSTLPYSSIEKRMALRMQGKDDNLRTGDFIDFGRLYGIPEAAVSSMVHSLCKRAEPWLHRLAEIGFEEKQTEALKQQIQQRINNLRRG
jgi:serine/threonine-protein kinase HipA